MKVKSTQGSITAKDWEEIVHKLGDTTVEASNILWWHSYTSDTPPDGGYDDTDYVAIGLVDRFPKNRSHKWFAVHAGCDTTGWGCLGDYARVTYHDTYEDAVINGLTKESRKWLGLELEGE